MNITVTAIDELNDLPIVRFTCEYGSALAEWLGEPPAANNQYHVELDSDETLSVGSNFKLTESTAPRIWMSGANVRMVVVVEGVYEDTSTVSLRFGNSVMLMDYDGDFPSAGTWVELCIREPRLNNICL